VKREEKGGIEDGLCFMNVRKRRRERRCCRNGRGEKNIGLSFESLAHSRNESARLKV